MTTSTEQKSGQAEAQPQEYELSETDKECIHILHEGHIRGLKYRQSHPLESVDLPALAPILDRLKREINEMRASDTGRIVERYLQSLDC